MELNIYSVRALLSLTVLSNYGSNLDILFFVCLLIHRKWEMARVLVQENIDPATTVLTFQVLVPLYLFLQLVGFIRGLRNSSTATDGFPIKPMFFPCETKHVRMFPAKHGFSYSYLLTGVPVGFTGSTGGMISVDENNSKSSWHTKLFKPWPSWYIVSGDDHLGRGYDSHGLAGKLRKYLESEGIDPSQYAHAYLVTAARFLNYASNPVSFWLLYSKEKELAAMILEVNNTFDERRNYFLNPTTTETSSTTRYSGTWPKDFYVSTFNSRAGSYSVSSSTSPLHQNRIDTTLTLSDASGKAMLIARIYSTSPPLDPRTMTVWEKMRFLVSWWWVGLATFPRTVVQAFNLLVHKKMPWVSRPEPREATTPRHADKIEICIERQFRTYLRYLVEGYGEALNMTYIPAGLVGAESNPEKFVCCAEESMHELFEIRVLTPLFYSRLVKYSSVAEALDSEMLSGTISSSNISLLQNILAASPPTNNYRYSGVSNILLSPRETLSFALFSFLRNPTPPPAIPTLADETHRSFPQLSHPTKPQKLTPASEFDAFVRSSPHISARQKRDYASAVLRLILAQRFALGWLEILDLQIWVLKAGVIWWAAMVVV